MDFANRRFLLFPVAMFVTSIDEAKTFDGNPMRIRPRSFCAGQLPGRWSSSQGQRINTGFCAGRMMLERKAGQTRLADI